MNLKFLIVLIIFCSQKPAFALRLNCKYETVQCLSYVTNLWFNCFNCKIENVEIRQNTPLTVNTNDAQIKDVIRFEITKSTLGLIPNKIYKLFPGLLYLYVPKNEGLVEMKEGYFNGAENLIQFWAWDNEITVLKANSFLGATNLQTLGLHACEIKLVDKDAFRGMRKLEVLYMYDNYVKTLHKDTFKDNIILKDVRFKNNRIKTLSYDTFKNLRKLQIVELNDNTCINDGFTQDNSRLESELNKLCRDVNDVSILSDADRAKFEELKLALEYSHYKEKTLKVQLLAAKNEKLKIEKHCQEQTTYIKVFEKMFCLQQY